MLAAELRGNLADHVGAHVPPTGSPAWKRYAEPAAMLRRAKSLTNGGWALDWSAVEPAQGVTRPLCLAVATWAIMVSYQLSPAATGGKLAEEQLVSVYADSLRAHLFGFLQGGAQAMHGCTHVWDGEDVKDALPDGWVWLTMRGKTTFYLRME